MNSELTVVKKYSLLDCVFFVSLCCLFISMVTNIKRHTCFDITVFFSFLCLVKSNISVKSIIRNSAVLCIFCLLTALSPRVNNDYITLSVRVAGAFLIGYVSEICLKRIWVYLTILPSISLFAALILYIIKLENIKQILDIRMSLTMSSIGLMAYIAAYSIIYMFHFISKSKKKLSYLLIIPFISCLAIILFTATRIVIFGLCICVIYWFYFLRKKFLPYFLILVTTLCTILFSSSVLMDRLRNSQTYSSLNARFTIWEMSIKIVSNKLLFGVTDSLNEFKEFLKNKSKIEKLTFKYNDLVLPQSTPHNIYIAMLYYFGIIGFMAFILLICHNIKIAFKAKNILFISILLFYLTTGLFDYQWDTIHGIFFYFFSM